MFGKMDVNRIKADINLLREAVHAGISESHPEWLREQVRKARGGVSAVYTQLCALRATMRGRIHFSPKTDVIWAKSVFGVPAKAELVDGEWKTMPIDLAVQTAWVEPLVQEYLLTLQP